MSLQYRLLMPSILVGLCVTAPSAEVFRDLSLSGGLNLSAVNTAAKPLETGVVLRSGGNRAEWRLAQWGTQFDLKDGLERDLPGGTRILRNSGKRVTVLPGGLAGEGIKLQVSGGDEFNGALRKEGEVWPHLLLEQKIPRDFQIASLSSLDFKLSFKVDHCTNASVEALDPSLHTAQATAYWTIHNRNKESKDFGEMIWFGVPLFDARHEIPQGHQAVDAGSAYASGKFINTVEGSRFYDCPTGDGQWHDIACDLKPMVEEALTAAQAQGHLANTRFADLYASSFNIGWEVPGPYDCAITLKGLSLDEVME